MKRTSRELKRLARYYLTGNYTIPVLTTFLASILPGICLSAFPFDQTNPIATVSIIYYFAAVIVYLLAQLLIIGVLRIHLQIAHKQKVTLSDLFWVFNHQPDRYLLGSILLDLFCLFPALILLSIPTYFIVSNRLNTYLTYTILAIVLIIITILELYLNCTYCLVFLLYIDFPSYHVLEAFKASRSLMKGNKIRFLYLQLSFIGFYILGILSFGLGFLWVSPYIRQTNTNLYLDITNGFSRFEVPSSSTEIHIDTTI